MVILVLAKTCTLARNGDLVQEIYLKATINEGTI